MAQLAPLQFWRSRFAASFLKKPRSGFSFHLSQNLTQDFLHRLPSPGFLSSYQRNARLWFSFTRSRKRLFEFLQFPHLDLFLCSTLSPVCPGSNPEGVLPYLIPIPPCQNLCEIVVSDCAGIMEEFGIDLPELFNCLQFPDSRTQPR